MKQSWFIVFCILVGCSNPKGDSGELNFSTKELSTEKCIDEKCAKVEISWPEANSTEVGQKINVSILSHLMAYFRQDTVFSDLQSAAEDFVKSYEEFNKDFPDSPGEWTVEIDAEKSYESDSLVSIKFSEFEFTGGAHPNSSVNFLTFNKSNGFLMGTDQLILDQDKFLQKTEQAFRDFHDVPDSVSLENDGRFFLPESGFFLPNAIGFEGDKLMLIYIPYEIGPYSLGYTNLEFELNELEGIIKK